MIQKFCELRTFILEDKQNRPYVLAFTYLLFVAGFVLLRLRIDYIVNLYYGIPLILATYYYGFWTGMLLLLAEALVHTLILAYLGEDYSIIYLNARVRIAFVSLTVVGYIVSVFRKVKNELKISGERYRALSDELQKTNSAKDRFFSIIAHDLRGPIGAINSNIDLIINAKDDLTEQDRHDLMQALHTMSTRVFSLLENLLKWAMVQQGNLLFHFENINARAVCEDGAMLFQPIGRAKKIAIENLVPDNLMIWADKNALDAVVRNLISNALKFSYPNGTVTLSARQSLKTVRLIVKDNGMGIRQEVLDKLFKTKQEVSGEGTDGEKGSGLGLLLSHELIQKCNGTISVESQPGHGSTFTIELPVHNVFF